MGKGGGTWRILRFPDRMWVGQVHSWSHGWPYFPLRKLPWKFHFDIFIRHLSRMEGHSSWYLADIEGSWWDTWMTGSSLISLMTKFDTKKRYFESFVSIFSLEVCQEGGPVWWYLEDIGGSWQEISGQGHAWYHGCTWWTPRIISWKFCIICIFGVDIRVKGVLTL